MRRRTRLFLWGVLVALVLALFAPGVVSQASDGKISDPETCGSQVPDF